MESFGGFTLSDIAEKDDYMEIEVKRLPFIHRATKIISDKKGRNFAVLQGAPYARYIGRVYIFLVLHSFVHH